MNFDRLRWGLDYEEVLRCFLGFRNGEERIDDLQPNGFWKAIKAILGLSQYLSGYSLLDLLTTSGALAPFEHWNRIFFKRELLRNCFR